MGTTAQKLKKLLDNKRAIRDAITEKTGEDAGEVMSTYAEKILAIEGGGTKYFRTTILLDQTITDPATMITKVYDDGGISQIRLNSHRYVCKLVDGVMQAKQLQDNNGTLYLDGTAADLKGGEGDVMMKLPEFYYRATEQETDKWLIDFVYGERPSEDYKHWDGKDFIGVYESYAEEQKIYSVSSSSPSGGIAQSKLVEYARNRGDGYSIISWSHHSMMAFLFFAYYLHTNSQLMCGNGSSGPNGENDLLGMEDTKKGHTAQVNFWGLEGWWGKRYEWLGNVNSNAYQWSIIGNDGTVRTVSGLTANGFSSKILIGPNLDAISLAAGASSTTGYCDRCLYSGGNDVVVARGTADVNNAGVVCYDADMSKEQIVGSSATRLAYRGEYETFDGVFDAEYEALEYFESNGSQYFDTGFKHNQNTRVVMRVKANSTPTTNGFFFDGPSDSNKRKGVFWLNSSRQIAVDYEADSNRQMYSKVLITDVLLIDYNKNACNINDEIKGFTEKTFQSTSNLTLLASNFASSASAPIAATLYFCQIYDNGTLIRDYVPCVRKADGVSGLWDKVNKTFITPTSI